MCVCVCARVCARLHAGTRVRNVCVCVRACVRLCVRASVRACVRACALEYLTCAHISVDNLLLFVCLQMTTKHRFYSRPTNSIDVTHCQDIVLRRCRYLGALAVTSRLTK